jgi:ABC-2 type transport system permease protein
MKPNVILAVFKRNFLGYFSSPIGYVFICAFVLLTAFAAFWPRPFFNANLANLDQLNRYLPFILLVFIPAVTMSIWAEERRQGTDELLLTLPARDLEIVIGKYLAALATYTVALLFSMSNIVVLIGLGEPDVGLLIANYVGYWCVGAAMIAVGMVASFLTSNLTVAFILAVALNAPLAFAESADAIVRTAAASRFVRGLSLGAQFADFGRGVITLSSLAYFAAVAAVMLYVSMILIGRRHWGGRRAGLPLWAHYTVRGVCAACIALAVIVVAARIDLRLDVSSARLSSLSRDTTERLADAGVERPVVIEAYVSPEVPEEYVQTRLNFLSMLREVGARGGDRIVVRVNETELFSDEAAEAREQFGIAPRAVPRGGGDERPRQGGDPLHRPRPLAGVRARPLHRDGERAAPIEARGPRDRRPALRRLRHAVDVEATGPADRR